MNERLEAGGMRHGDVEEEGTVGEVMWCVMMYIVRDVGCGARVVRVVRECARESVRGGCV